MNNKKAQFFIIGSVILGIIILNIATVWNYSLKKDLTEKKFRTLCQNYKNEIFEISKQVVESGNKNEEQDAILEFTMQFLQYIKTNEPNFKLIYVYGNSSNIVVFNYTQMQLTTIPEVNWQTVNGYYIGYGAGDWMNISNTKINKSYRIYQDERFYFIAFEEKEGEFYICE